MELIIVQSINDFSLFKSCIKNEMDILVLQNQLLIKSEQPKIQKDETWMQEFKLD